MKMWGMREGMEWTQIFIFIKSTLAKREAIAVLWKRRNFTYFLLDFQNIVSYYSNNMQFAQLFISYQLSLPAS